MRTRHARAIRAGITEARRLRDLRMPATEYRARAGSTWLTDRAWTRTYDRRYRAWVATLRPPKGPSGVFTPTRCPHRP